MRRALVSVLLAAGLCLSQSTQALCLWSVSDGDSDIWLAGSIHLLTEDDYPLPVWFEPVWSAAEQVVFETDIDRLNSMQAAQTMLALGTYPAGESLADYLDQSLLDRTLTAGAQLGLPSPFVERARPWFIAASLTLLAAQQQGYSSEWGLDLKLSKRAIEAGKGRGGLESLEGHQELLAGLPQATQIEFLEQTLDDLQEAEALIGSLVDAWRQCDQEALVQVLTDALQSSPDLAERLLYKRNRDWVADMQVALATNAANLYVVGAAHLVGNASVIELLTDLEYQISVLHPSANNQAIKRLAKLYK